MGISIVMTIGLSHLHAPSFKIRLFAFSSEISQWIFVKIHCENAEFGSLRDPGLLQVFNLQQPLPQRGTTPADLQKKWKAVELPTVFAGKWGTFGMNIF